MKNRPFAVPALALIMALLVPSAAFAQAAASAILQPAGGQLWSRTDSSGGLSHEMKAEETAVSPDRSLFVLSDAIGLAPENALAAYFSTFVVTYRESLLRDSLEDAEFRIEATPATAAIVLQNYFDVTFPWGTERFGAEYPLAGGGQSPATIVLRYNLFKLRYSLSGLDRLAATTPIDALDRQRVIVKLYSDRGTFSIDMPIAFFIELYARLKARF